DADEADAAGVGRAAEARGAGRGERGGAYAAERVAAGPTVEGVAGGAAGQVERVGRAAAAERAEAAEGQTVARVGIGAVARDGGAQGVRPVHLDAAERTADRLVVDRRRRQAGDGRGGQRGVDRAGGLAVVADLQRVAARAAVDGERGLDAVHVAQVRRGVGRD